MSPCRVVDTRNPAGTYGGPMIAAGVPRTFNIVASGCTGIPAGVAAFSLNFTAVGATGNGMLLAWPAGGSQPSISVLNYVAGQTVANAAIVPAGSGSSITVVAGVHATNLIIDVNGYFLGGGGVLNTGEGLWLRGNHSANAVLRATNGAADGTGILGETDGGPGVAGVTFGSGSGAAGVYGFAASSTSTNFGVLGVSAGRNGSAAVLGQASGASRVYGVSGWLVSSSATKGAAGVYGRGAPTAAITSGVLGESMSTTADSAGVIGRDATAIPASSGIFGSAGVRGEAAGNGVVGLAASSGVGVAGLTLTSGGGIATLGYLGTNGYGIFSVGNLGATGTKAFLEPHPFKPGVVIRYVALEGPEAGTYFRGRGRFVGGSAVIDVPESFRLVTDEEGITVQVTPIGGLAAFGVSRIGLDVIEVACTKDLEFSYLVQGVRKTFRDFQVEVESRDFMPTFPTSTMPASLSEGQRRNLIQSGVYNEDGTVNVETARRLGWDEVWETRAAVTPGHFPPPQRWGD